MRDSDIQRWSREVAEDPGAPSFVRLARAYRRQGRRDVARDVVLRGLERNPEHVDAHSLLALIHVEGGDRQRAMDEWETVLRLDPTSFDASRGLGFLALERGDLDAAHRYLETAARARPGDPTVAQARQVLAARRAGPKPGATAVPAGPAGPATGRDPARLFDELARETPFRGALVLDEQGLVLAGGLTDDQGRGEFLGALLDAVVDEARRAAELVRLGEWRGVLLECGDATVHVAALPTAGVVVMVATRDAPAGWVARAARRARSLAASFMEAGS